MLPFWRPPTDRRPQGSLLRGLPLPPKKLWPENPSQPTTRRFPRKFVGLGGDRFLPWRRVAPTRRHHHDSSPSKCMKTQGWRRSSGASGFAPEFYCGGGTDTAGPAPVVGPLPSHLKEHRAATFCEGQRILARLYCRAIKNRNFQTVSTSLEQCKRTYRNSYF